MDTKQQEESREYPSRLFFMDLLAKEARKTSGTGRTLTEVLDQMRVIWKVEHRDRVFNQLEFFLGKRHSYRFPDELQLPVTSALYDMVRSAETLPKGDRHRTDTAVSKFVRYLDVESQLEILEPWFNDSRVFRTKTVLRTLQRVEDLSPYADYLVEKYRDMGNFDILRLISRTPNAAAQITADELDGYFERYENHSSSYSLGGMKYHGMIAAKVLVIGDNPIPPELLTRVPVLFSWAIEEIGDQAYESLLIWIILENLENPEVLWSAIRCANRMLMPRALEHGIDAARNLLFRDEGILLLP